MTSGQINGIYAKWFLQPVPPKNINFQFDISAELKALYAKPNDEAAY